MAQNMLNYTDLDYDKIISQVEDRLVQDGFTSLIDSKLLSLCVDVFGSSVDFIVYYLERRAEECYFDTARLRSSIILLSRQLGYSVRRPIPATTSINITLSGRSDLVGEPLNGREIHFPKFSTTFRFGAYQFILRESFVYEIGPADEFGNPDWSVTLSFAVKEGDKYYLKSENDADLYDESEKISITIMQGELREFTLRASENPISGEIFQKYLIPDLEFSNLFGKEDFSYDPETGEFDLLAGLTQISVTSPNEDRYTDETLYTIDRRSLINHETLYRDSWDKFYDGNGNFIEQNIPKIVVVRTDRSEAVELHFGDGLISQYPKSDQTIQIRYFATKGSAPNKVGVIGKKITSNSNIFISSSSLIDISGDIEYHLNRNIMGGADMESIESIKLNAPSVYNSLDRLIATGDYVAYLRGLKSPIPVRHAIVWGEQEEARMRGVRAIQKYSNIAFYSILGDLYLETNDGRYIPKHLISSDIYNVAEETGSLNADALLEAFDYTIYSPQAYFNVLVADNLVTMKSFERKIYETFFNRTTPPWTESQVDMANQYPTGHPVSQLNAKLEARAQLTVKHQYVTPILQFFDITGTVVIRDFADLSVVENRVLSEMYKYLNEKINFNSPVYKSVIIDIIKSDKDVLYCDLKFDPVASNGTTITDWENEPEFDAQIPYETTALRVVQTVDSPNSATVVESGGTYDVVGLYDETNYAQLIGKSIQFSQDGGATKHWGEISNVYKTDGTSNVDYTIVGTLLDGQFGTADLWKWYSYFDTTDSKWYLVKRVIVTKRIGNVYQQVPDFVIAKPNIGDLVFNSNTGNYLEYQSSFQFIIIPAPATDIKVEIKSSTLLDTTNDSLTIEVVTNMDAIIADLGFCPKGYLVEGFVNSIQAEVQRLFDIVICKQCETCPDDEVPLISVPENYSSNCKPLGVTREVEGTIADGDGCVDPGQQITWSDYYKATHPKDYKSWTNCDSLSLLTQDDMYAGAYNSNLDIAKFESVVLPKYPWRQNAPDKGVFDEGWVTEVKLHHRIGGITERWFYTELMRNVIIELRRIANKKSGNISEDFYTSDRQILDKFLDEFGNDGTGFDINNIKDFVISKLQSSVYISDSQAIENVENFLNSDSFRGLMFKLHNGLTKAIRSSMLDNEGNITRYSLRNEIVQLRSQLSFRYRS